MRAQLFSPAFKASLNDYDASEIFRQHAQRVEVDDPLALVQYLDMKTYLVGDINTKVDRASMAHSLEVREPLMDHPLIEWLGTLPSSFKVRRGEGKALLKDAMKPYLPADLMHRPKQGFAVPLSRWFRGPLRDRMRDAILGERLEATGYFDRRYLQQMVEQHASGSRDYSAPLWTLLMFDAFLANVAQAEPSRPREEVAG
jgi:asparagine synthase (glutamine-hydrolysing)